MLSTLRTLIRGTNARAEQKLRDIYSVDLIEQKIRDAEQGLKSAKVSLAGLIQRKRAETRQAEDLQHRIEDLGTRLKAALEAGETELAQEAAKAIADMENELTLRQDTIRHLASRVLRLESSVEAAHRRLTGLKQGALAAKAIKREQDIQAKLAGSAPTHTSAMDEADALISEVMSRDDPFERSEILQEIDAGLTQSGLADRMAAKHLGSPTKTTAADVLARFS